jgi:hypothetical protein
MKHGLVMSLILGITATLGALGGSPAGGIGATAVSAAAVDAPTPIQIAANTPAAPTASASPVVSVTVDDDVAKLLNVKPAQLAQATPSAPVGVSGAAPANDPGLAAKAAGINAIACGDVYLDFVGAPRNGPAPLGFSLFCRTSYADGGGGPTSVQAPAIGVQFTLRRQGDPTFNLQVVSPLNPNTSFDLQPVGPAEGDELLDGIYDVTMRVVLQDPANAANLVTCPPESEPPFRKNSFFIVGGAPEATASFDIQDRIADFDTFNFVPQEEWIPILSFTMNFSPDQPAPRTLAELEFQMLDANGDLLPAENILQFGLFADGGEDGADGVLDHDIDGHIAFTPFLAGTGNAFRADLIAGLPMLTWGSSGLPFDTPTSSAGDSSYNLNFTFNPTDPAYLSADPLNTGNPQWPFIKEQLDPATIGPALNWVISWNNENPNWGYILAIRASNSIPSGQCFSVRVTDARMLPYSGDPFDNYRNTALPFGAIDPSNTDDVISTLEPITNPPLTVDPFPFTEDGARLDSYAPDFQQGDILDERATRCTNFDVWDFTGGLSRDNRFYPDLPPDGIVNAGRTPWNWPNKLYTPVAEHTRPRWDLGENIFNALGGEWMDLRRVISLEEWVPVIGINVHGGCGTYLTDVNVILTDIGGDPFGPPGNGGFDPTEGLDPMTTQVHGNAGSDQLGELYAIGRDYTFNGVGVFSDTGGGNPCSESPPANCGGNTVFDPPSPRNLSAGEGVNFTDLPLEPVPLTLEQMVEEGFFQWEYVPFPPGGGDPWWRVRMKFSQGGARGFLPCDGQLEPTAEFAADYFVVLRADSGFTDVSGTEGDGTGLPFGADTRAFLEPRSWNPLDGGHWEGGINFSNIFALGAPLGNELEVAVSLLARRFGFRLRVRHMRLPRLRSPGILRTAAVAQRAHPKRRQRQAHSLGRGCPRLCPDAQHQQPLCKADDHQHRPAGRPHREWHSGRA